MALYRLALLLAIPALLLVAWIGLLNLLRNRVDRKFEDLPDREPLADDEFCGRFFPDFPPATVCRVRARFARAVGVAPNLLLPDDSFHSFGRPPDPERLQDFIADYAMARGAAAESSGANLVSGELRTLEDFIRAQSLLDRLSRRA